MAIWPSIRHARHPLDPLPPSMGQRKARERFTPKRLRRLRRCAPVGDMRPTAEAVFWVGARRRTEHLPASAVGSVNVRDILIATHLGHPRRCCVEGARCFGRGVEILVISIERTADGPSEAHRAIACCRYWREAGKKEQSSRHMPACGDPCTASPMKSGTTAHQRGGIQWQM